MFHWKKKTSWNANEAAGSSTHLGHCTATLIHVVLRKRPGELMSTVLAKIGFFRVVSTTEQGSCENTEVCVGVHRKSLLDDSHLLCGQKVFSLGRLYNKEWTAWTNAANCHLWCPYHISDSTCVSHLTMYKTVMCLFIVLQWKKLRFRQVE